MVGAAIAAAVMEVSGVPAMVPPAPAPVLVSDFPEIEISRAQSPHEWPFAVESGRLTCVAFNGQRVVLFSEPWRTDVPQEFGDMTLPRSVIVSANPFAIFASGEDRTLYAPFDSLETLIRRLGPFEAMGTLLCERGEADP